MSEGPTAKTIWSFTGDQRGRCAGSSPNVICLGSPEARLLIQTCGTPSTELRKAIMLPSGEKLGARWEPGNMETRTCWPIGAGFRCPVCHHQNPRNAAERGGRDTDPERRGRSPRVPAAHRRAGRRSPGSSRASPERPLLRASTESARPDPFGGSATRLGQAPAAGYCSLPRGGAAPPFRIAFIDLAAEAPRNGC